jgi:hypothetical protein
VVPVTGIGEHDIGRPLDACGAQLVLGGADHRFEVAEGGRVDGDLGAMTICSSVATP